MNIKTGEQWGASRLGLDQFLTIGDHVDEEIYDHFINVLPPATFSSTLVQMGEPYSHINGKATYFTLAHENGHWTYKGTCHRGSIETI